MSIIHHKTRNGCVRCKERKVKCDMHKPCCQNCERLHLHCEYQKVFLWHDDAERRGIAFGREGVWSKDGKKHITPETVDAGTYFVPIANRHFKFVNFYSKDVEDPSIFEADIDLDHQKSDGMDKLTDSSPNTGSSNTESADIPESRVSFSDSSASRDYEIPKKMYYVSPLEEHTVCDNILFQFYSEVVCSNCTLFDDESNGFRYVIVPMALTSPALMHSLLTVAASAYKNKFSEMGEYITFHKNATLKALVTLGKSGTVDSKLQVLATAMMLCIFEIKNGCCPDWYIHMKGAIGYCRAKAVQNSSDDLLSLFAKKYFAYQLVNYETFCEDEEPELLLNDMWTSGSFENDLIDGHLGCSLELMGLINKISKISFLQSKDRYSKKCWNISYTLEGKLLSLVQYSKHLSVICSESSNTRHLIDTILSNPTHKVISVNSFGNITYSSVERAVIELASAEMRRNAALIYLYIAVDGEDSSSSLVQQRVEEVVKYIELINDLDPLDKPVWGMACLLWPIFITGLQATTKGNRVVIIEFLKGLKLRNGIGNVDKILNVFRRVWKWKTEVEPAKLRSIPMKKLVDPVCWRLSLG